MKTRNLKQFMAALFLSSIAEVHTDRPMFRGHSISAMNPIFIPRRGKFKGYMRENRRRCTFNKNK
jgi:hypothetical protein